MFHLAAGPHTLVFRGREPMARLDTIVVTTDRSYRPEARPAAVPPLEIYISKDGGVAIGGLACGPQVLEDWIHKRADDERDLQQGYISNLSVIDVTQTSARILWTTDEPSTSVVSYGTDASYGQSASSISLETTHSVILTGLMSRIWKPESEVPGVR